VDHLVIVSVGEGKDRKLYVYNSCALPAEIVRLYDLMGDYIDTRDESQHDKPKAP
jgi:hypothetical protein